jgi:hypothetical protein
MIFLFHAEAQKDSAKATSSGEEIAKPQRDIHLNAKGAKENPLRLCDFFATWREIIN